MFTDQPIQRNSTGSLKALNTSGNQSKFIVEIQREQCIENMIDIKDMINEPTLGSPEKVANPTSGERRSSAAQPVNINLGSDTRFSNIGRNFLSNERS